VQLTTRQIAERRRAHLALYLDGIARERLR
jgi:hypothetical protein